MAPFTASCAQSLFNNAFPASLAMRPGIAIPAATRRTVLLYYAPIACLIAAPATAESDERLANVGTAEDRLRRSGALDAKNSADPRCQSGVFLNFKPGTCSPVGNIYERMEQGKTKAQMDELDDFAADFMKKSGIRESDANDSK